MKFSIADLAYHDMVEGHLNLRNAPSRGEDALNDEADAWLRGDHAPALKLQAEHTAKVRARTVPKTTVDRVKAMANTGESVAAIMRACSISRKMANGVIAGKTPRVYVDNHAAIRLRKAGKKLKEIAGELKCSITRVHEMTSESMPKRAPIPRERIKSLRAEGWTIRAIKAEVRCSEKTILNVLQAAAE